MNVQEVTVLYAYNCWANEQILAATLQLDAGVWETQDTGIPHPLNAILCHIFNTEYAWRSLSHNGQYPEDLAEPEMTRPALLATRWHDEMLMMQAYLARLSDSELLQVVRFTANSQTRERVRWHGFLHIINHGTHHRSEAATILTNVGHSPGDLDFTRFLNQP